MMPSSGIVTNCDLLYVVRDICFIEITIGLMYLLKWSFRVVELVITTADSSLLHISN